MSKLQSLLIINQKDRITSIDFFRALAIITVVIFHFNHFLPYGYLGVDLFFVISGLLIGNLLTKELENTSKIKFGRFFISRGFKIWPSYYFFLFTGTLLAKFFYSESHPDQIISFGDFPKYLFFYHNYTGGDFHWSFDHVWSLCVEEHFYLMLPLLYIFASRIKKTVTGKYVRFLFISTLLVVMAGIMFKFISFHFTNSQDTYSATHNRIDALAWGVLLNLIINYTSYNFENRKRNTRIIISGILTLSSAILYSYVSDDHYFNKVIMHSITCFSFFLLLLGSYKVSFYRFKTLRFISYYSYNWYLWHPLFVYFLTDYFGKTFLGLAIYLIVSFLVSLVCTVLIEEPMLRVRKKILSFRTNLNTIDGDSRSSSPSKIAP